MNIIILYFVPQTPHAFLQYINIQSIWYASVQYPIEVWIRQLGSLSLHFPTAIKENERKPPDSVHLFNTFVDSAVMFLILYIQ